MNCVMEHMRSLRKCFFAAIDSDIILVEIYFFMVKTSLILSRNCLEVLLRSFTEFILIVMLRARTKNLGIFGKRLSSVFEM